MPWSGPGVPAGNVTYPFGICVGGVVHRRDESLSVGLVENATMRGPVEIAGWMGFSGVDEFQVRHEQAGLASLGSFPPFATTA